MKIAVSACLLGENCKYNGGNNQNNTLLPLLKDHEIVAICPEVLGGLGIPREPAEIVRGVVTTKDGINVDEAFRKGAEKALQIALDFGAELMILQSRSPSCGVGQIYDGSFSGQLFAGDGVFAKRAKESGFCVYDVSDGIHLLSNLN